MICKKIVAILLSLASVFALCACRTVESNVSPGPMAETFPNETEAQSSLDTTYAPEPEAEAPEDTSVTISMVGDVLLHEKVYESGEMADGTYNYDHLFANLKDEIEASDIAIVNQEIILGGRELGLSGYPSFNGAYEVGDSLVSAGFDIVLHATNHAIDKGARGISNCISFWRDSYPDIAVLGINSSAEEQSSIYIREENGIKIAFLNYTYGTNGIPLPSEMPYCVNILEKEALVRDIAKAEAMADFTVVLPHWGTEYVHEPDNDQKYWTQIMFDCGADLVIGTHPHVIQPVELIEDEDHSMLVYYSLGNFINSTAQTGPGIADRMVGGMANITLSRDKDGRVYIKDYGITPLVTHVRSGRGLITTYKLSDYTDSLAAENEIIASDPAFSLLYCLELVNEVFGSLIE